MVCVLVAGIGGASLGTEVGKSLRLAEGYRLIGCDVSPLAFGHYAGLFDVTEVVSVEDYVQSVLDVCARHGVNAIVPGGEQPAVLLARASDKFQEQGILLAGNNSDVVAGLSDKANCFRELESMGIPIPETHSLATEDGARRVPLPCIVKPSLQSGGSAFVFFARTRDEVELYAAYLRNNGYAPIAQKYIPHDAGEFTVGVLSDPKGGVEGVIALRRVFPSKLSVAAKGEGFLISSGYSQGHIDAYPEICALCAQIAERLGSTGPLNIQGRLDAHGSFLPFEINPRFSASTYLRSLAGFNEIDHFISTRLGLKKPTKLAVKTGWYLRGLTETYVPLEGLKA